MPPRRPEESCSTPPHLRVKFLELGSEISRGRAWARLCACMAVLKRARSGSQKSERREFRADPADVGDEGKPTHAAAVKQVAQQQPAHLILSLSLSTIVRCEKHTAQTLRCPLT